MEADKQTYTCHLSNGEVVLRYPSKREIDILMEILSFLSGRYSAGAMLRISQTMRNRTLVQSYNIGNFSQSYEPVDFSTYNGTQKDKIPGIINITIPGINNKFIINNLKNKIAISTGSACSIGEPSHVLKAIGMDSNEITSTIRISLSKFNTNEEINEFLKLFIEEIKKYK